MVRKFSKFILAIVFILLMLINISNVANENMQSTKEENISLKELTIDEKLEDFNYLYDTFLKNYPYFQVQKDKLGIDWEKNKNEFKGKVLNTTSNEEFYKALNEILNSLQNIHTDIIHPGNLQNTRDAFNSTSFNQWKNILNNKEIIEKNKQWQSLIAKNTNSLMEQIIPVAFYYVEGKYLAYDIGYVDCESFGIKKGEELIAVNNIPIDEYINKKVMSEKVKYDFSRKKPYLSYLTFKEAFSFNIKLEVKGNDGIREVSLNSNYYDEINYEINGINSKDNLFLDKDEGKKLGYIAIKSFYYGNIEKDKQKINNFYNEIEDYKTLIIDIRGNGGGAESYWTDLLVAPLITKELSYKYNAIYRDGQYIKPFIEERIGKKIKKLKNKNSKKVNEKLNGVFDEIGKGFSHYKEFKYDVKPSKEKINFKGKIYLIVNDEVYSAAESFSIFSKATGFATLVGSTTGGDGIGIDPILLPLSNSGLIVRFPAEVGVSPDYTINEKSHTSPDIFVEQKIKDFVDRLNWQKKNKNDRISPYDNVVSTLLDICN